MKNSTLFGIHTLALTLTIAVLVPVALCEAEPGQEAPAFRLKDLDGKEHALADYKGKIVVLEWINKDCPFVRKHYSVGNMQKLQREYMAQEVVWLAVCSSAPGKQGHFDVETWRKRAEKSKMTPTAILLDPAGETGRAYKATHTPHMFVIDAEGKVVYNGAIDNDRSTNSAKVEGAHNYVVAALDALLKGEKIATPKTKPYGCTVKY